VILREEFLEPMGLTQQELATAINSPALCLARYVRTSAGFWMNLQLRFDLYETERSEKEALEEIEPLHSVG
jgi:plasmid maintenance system antidote protein VapI